jgi:hypothetical protein
MKLLGYNKSYGYKRITIQQTICKIILNITAVDPISFAFLANGWISFVTKSTTFSIAELINSTIRTNIPETNNINLFVKDVSTKTIPRIIKTATKSSNLKELSVLKA